ncbi:MAG: formate dehydrogenase accessory sulfurtransferase FdhD [Anditalea sp.]
MKTVSPVTLVPINRWMQGENSLKEDLLAVEEPLQIKLQFGQGDHWQEKALAVTMRTPGHDFELAIGFLLAENIIHGPEDIQLIRYCKKVKDEEKGNVLIVKLSPSVKVDLTLLDRHFFTHSSCGVCGKSAIEAITCEDKALVQDFSKVKTSLLKRLNQMLMKEQTVFKYTGGIHASALFRTNGELLFLREDVGRHNAFDKVVGAAFQQKLLPLSDGLMMLSGRVSFELIQKAIRARIPIIAAVGAPSSLAVSLAKEKGITLIGFLKNDRFNIYSGKERVEMEES